MVHPIRMKQIFLNLEIKPKSTNNKLIPIKRGRGMRLATNPAYLNYLKELSLEFRKNINELMRFKLDHDEDRHALETTWRVYIPSTEYFTKKGRISKTCIDCTNTVKMMEDVLKDTLGIDDSQIIRSSVEKIPTDKSIWFVSLELSRVMKPAVLLLNI